MLMLLYNRNMQKDAKSIRVGFTIIEVMLFLALTGLLLSGVLVGLGSNLSRQRYNDAVEDVADVLQSQYSFVSDIRISKRTKTQDSSCYALVSSDITGGDAASYYNSVAADKSKSISYRGRTNCVVYGAVVVIDGKKNTIQASELIGRDYATMAKEAEINGTTLPENYNDLQILKNIARANNVAVHCPSKGSGAGCYIHTADNLTTNTIKWGVKLVDVSGNDLRATLLIFRSPRDGSIRTYVWNGFNAVSNAPDADAINYETMNNSNGGSGIAYSASSLDKYGINKILDGAHFKNDADLRICIDTGSAQTYSQHQRMIKIIHNGSGQSAVQLVDADSQEAGDQCSK